MKNAAKVTLATSAIFFAASAAAQEPDRAHLSLVAGYKTAFTCSAHFNAGRSIEEIAGDELHRIYSGYREAMAELPDAEFHGISVNATPDGEEPANYFRAVSVTYDENEPPRYAVWRPHLGCVQLPTYATQWAAIHVPMIDLEAPELGPSDLWPEGDAIPTTFFADTPQGYNLAGVVADAFDRMTYGEGTETTAVIVVENGKIVAEKYRDGISMTTPQRTWSVAKSIASSIIGAAVKEGVIDVSDRAALSAWEAPADPRRDITIENLLHMSSGLTSPHAGNRTDDVYFGGGRVVDHAITNRLVAEPGTRWRYANNDTMAAMRALREKIDDDDAYLRFPFERLLHKIGMRHTFLETDWNGDFILSSQVWTTARDLARLGLLYLNDGVWNGERVLPEDWNDYVATPAPAQPPATRSNGDPYPGYGAQWWLYDEKFGLPKGTYAARGNRGQYLMIIPERNVLIVRRGFDDGGGFALARFSADILAALPE
ncbi:MAG: beta-lactamase family protein [Marinicaulis sp.]|nr:beta-lactamase family protein [Marinicaulis sp.]